jgi:ABC-type nitrate/sulfonate/bicarbonate transport system permease component
MQRERLITLGYWVGTLLALSVLWWWAAASGRFTPHVLPPPQDVFESFGRVMDGYMGGDIWTHLWASLKVVFLSFSLAVLIGVPVGVLMAWIKPVGVVMSPLISMLRPIPPPAWIPLAILWFGIELKGKVFVCFVAAIVPVLVNSFLAIQQTQVGLLNAARTLGASRTRLLFEVALPSGLPVIMTGLRISLGLTWATIVAAELVVASAGFGFLIMNGYRNFESAIMAGAMIGIAVVAVLMNVGFEFVERRILHWIPRND